MNRMGEKDLYHHKGLRRKLVERLSNQGIMDQDVLEAILEVPRHLFVDSAFAHFIYQEKAFPIGEGQTISSPFTVAYQSQLLDLEKRMTVLEVGTGSGYQAAVLAQMGARVYTVERQKKLYNKTSALLKKLAPGIRCYHRDGYKGLPEFAPFDRIIVTAGAPEIPEELKLQLKIGGKMVIPVGKKTQRMTRITRRADEDFLEEYFKDFRFVPFLKGKV